MLLLPGGKRGQPWMPQQGEATKSVPRGLQEPASSHEHKCAVLSNVLAASAGNAGYTGRLKAYAKSLSPFSGTGYQPARFRA